MPAWRLPLRHSFPAAAAAAAAAGEISGDVFPGVGSGLDGGGGVRPGVGRRRGYLTL